MDGNPRWRVILSFIATTVILILYCVYLSLLVWKKYTRVFPSKPAESGSKPAEPGLKPAKSGLKPAESGSKPAAPETAN